jgi:hypothetical protein
MTEEQKVSPESSTEPKPGPSDGWQEVGQQFQALGESLAQAVRAAWANEEPQRRVQEMRTGLESMVRDVSQAVEDTANTPQGQKVRQDAEHAAESLRTATEQTVQEVRPQIINALQQLNEELQKLINRMDQKGQPPTGGQPPSSGPDQPM